MQEFVATEDLHVNEANPRRGVGDVRELAASIKAIGIIEPLVVTAAGSVIAGSRRLAAAKMAGLKEVPVIRREADAREMQELMLIENLQREELAPLEEALSLQILVDLGRDQKDIAKRIGRSQPWVSKRLSLLALPAKAQEALYSGGISIRDAEDLAKVADTPLIVERVVDRIAAGEKNLSVVSAVGVERRHVELEAELQERKTALEAEGKKVLISEERGDIGGVRHLWGDDPSEHPECHAVVLSIGWQRLEEEDVCTDPDRHQDADDVREPDRAKEREQHEAERKVLELARLARIEACRELCRRMPNKQTSELIELGVIGASDEAWSRIEVAAEVLELIDKDLPEGAPESDIEQLADEITAYAARSDKARHHAALAVTAGQIEAELGWSLWTESLPRAYFALLATVGYQPTEAERAKLEPPEEVDDEVTDPDVVVPEIEEPANA